MTWMPRSATASLLRNTACHWEVFRRLRKSAVTVPSDDPSDDEDEDQEIPEEQIVLLTGYPDAKDVLKSLEELYVRTNSKKHRTVLSNACEHSKRIQ